MSNKGGNIHITLVCLSWEKWNNRRITSTGLKKATLCMSFGDKEWLERQHNNTGYRNIEITILKKIYTIKSTLASTSSWKPFLVTNSQSIHSYKKVIAL